MKYPTVSEAVFDPDDPLQKQLRHRFYKLGNRRHEILKKLCGIPELGDRGREKEYLVLLAEQGRTIELLREIQAAEAEKQSENQGALQSQG